MDRINRYTWGLKENVQWFTDLESWTDPGEKAATEAVADECRHLPILDIGVGAGRTVPLLRAISNDYTAVDFTPEMLEACKRRFPDVRVQFADARDLSVFPDDSFALVVFSFNGIDAVDEVGRKQILQEVFRVLRPGGLFLFSTHNHNGPYRGERFKLGVYFTRNPVKLGWRILRGLWHLSTTLTNFVRYSKLNLSMQDSSIMNASAHRHGLVIYYITLEKQRQQLNAAGFRGEPRIFDSTTGGQLDRTQDTSRTCWFHFVARKPAVVHSFSRLET